MIVDGWSLFPSFFSFFFHFSEMGVIIARDRITIFVVEVYFNVRKNFALIFHYSKAGLK